MSTAGDYNNSFEDSEGAEDVLSEFCEQMSLALERPTDSFSDEKICGDFGDYKCDVYKKKLGKSRIEAVKIGDVTLNRQCVGWRWCCL